ncbi:ImmA/IrrE family metallo-endopeptidase [Roseobacter ponti]|uniref:ImmA/IrrE family metallo-endopeptidase n=1 Tax=Roseobacter ponti TaxID=1891787 RepID=A0A858SYX2_9RHOB|nr:ImmA/IrrE family metallo-endopeptidase [Roseobacter ponti]QJF52853.1 ImmA/IrrE family metallo-endopeptidase [Roseobacter ponti]
MTFRVQQKLRKTRTERTNAKTDFSALEAWCAAVLAKADKVKIEPCKGFDPEATARRIAKVSARANWAREIADELNKIGIVLIVLEHLPGTYLDGAAMLRSDGVPVIALTIRHNRIDNFWFTLMHEFAHVCLHLNSGRDIILDDLDVSSADEIEAEADAFASEALIPGKLWLENIDGRSRTDDIKRVATRAGVHRAIAAGRWQHTFGDYRRFSKLLGRGEVRELFFG